MLRDTGLKEKKNVFVCEHATWAIFSKPTVWEQSDLSACDVLRDATFRINRMLLRSHEVDFTIVKLTRLWIC